MAAPTRTPRSTWIEAGLRALAAGGPDAVRIESLAKTLGVTRGGFYWHFTDRRELLDEVIERVEGQGGDPEARLLRLLGLTSPGVVAVDLAVRDWARHEQAVAGRLRRIDNRRMDYLRSLFAAFCPDADEVETRCLLYYSLLIGNHFIAADHGGLSRTDVVKLAIRRLGPP
jgi:AcrR family transcriptional regulator